MTKSEQSSAPIVVGIDFSDQSRLALKAAMQLAKDVDCELILVHAFPEMRVPTLMVGDMGKKIIDEARAEVSHEEAMTLHEDWVQKVRDAGLTAIPFAEVGEPADLIIQQATERNAGMIVVGSHGRTGLKRAMLGSVAEQVLRQADVPVLVVPTRAKGRKS